ncbi:MAG: TonB-dependent receptor [Ignavibacteria bacterium]
MNNQRCYFVVLITVLILLSNSYAQEEEEESKDSLKYQTDELVITGTRAFEKIIDIPYSVFKVDKKELNYGRKISAKDVLADVPGLFLQAKYGNHDIRITLRGFGTRSSTGVRGIRILQDGIPESEPDGETIIDAIDLTSLGGVEVVKGNLSSLYANAPGGVINFISDLYFPKNFVTLTNQIGKYGMRQNGVKFGIANNDFRLFTSYSYRNIDGYRPHSSEFGHLINSVFESYLGSKSTLMLSANYVNNLIRNPGSLTQGEFAVDPGQAYNLAVSQDFRRESQKGRLGLRFRTSLGYANSSEFELAGWGGIKEQVKTDNLFYVTSTRYNLGSYVRLTNRSEFNGRKNVFTTGVDFAYQSGPRTEFDNINGNKGLNVNNEFEDTQGNIGIFVQNQYELLKDKLQLYLATRFDYVDYSKRSLQFVGTVDTSRIFSKFNPKAALNFKLTDHIALYTSYSVGFDLPSISELDNNFTTSNIRYTMNPDLQPQKSNNFEFGIKGNIRQNKSEFMRKVLFEVTFFNYKLKDVIVPFAYNQTVYFRNAAKTNRVGVEVGFMSEPFEGIELTTNYTYTNFKYDDYIAEIYTPSGSYFEDYSGNFEPSIPQHILNFILAYEYELGKNFSGLLIWDCDYIAKMYVDDKNTQSTSPYFYGNIMAGINYNYRMLNVIFYAGATNIFDRRYAGYININDFFGRYYNMGEPRNFYSGLNLSFKF